MHRLFRVHQSIVMINSLNVANLIFIDPKRSLDLVMLLLTTCSGHGKIVRLDGKISCASGLPPLRLWDWEVVVQYSASPSSSLRLLLGEIIGTTLFT